MKRVFCILICMLLLCGCSAPVDDAMPSTTELNVELEAVCKEGTLKVLAIGNSFSNNTTDFLYDVAKAEGVTDILIGRLYIGGCALDRHARNAQNNAAEYKYYKTSTGTWDLIENATLLYALQDEQWDVITMQQSSGKSGQPDTYDGHLQELINYVNENKTNPDAKLVWHMTWAYQSDSDHKDFAVYGNSQEIMYQCIIDANKSKILTSDAFSAVIPAGTAIQNARNSYFGDMLTSDGYHLNALGKVIGSYIWYATLSGKTIESVHLDAIPGSIPLDEDNKAVIKEAVNNALKEPYQVTPSTITE